MSNYVALDSPLDLVPYPSELVVAYREAGYWRRQSLAEQLSIALSDHSDRPALITPEVRWTYAELHSEVRAFAAGLAARTGLTSGDRVMFQMGNVAETVVCYLGTLVAGMVPVCTLAQHGPREVELLAKHVGARGLITQADFGGGRLLRVAADLQGRGVTPHVVVVRGASLPGATTYEDVVASGRNELPTADKPELTAVAVFQLSGGTTGLPKVAPRLHEEYAYNSRAWSEALDWSEQTIVLYPLPLMHNAGIALALQPCLLAGGTLVLAPSADTDTILDLIETERPTSLPLVPPAVAIRMLEHPRISGTDLSSISQYIVGGQKLAVEVARKLRGELGLPLRQMFGMAEGMFLVTPPAAAEQVVLDTVGRPISPADEVRIVDPVTGEDVPAGQLGELWLRGPYTIRGYYRAAEHNSTAFSADGMYRTGDLGRVHTIDGVDYFSVDGRLKDVINRGVEKIHAEEVEELILHHPDVVNAAVVAIPDRVLGERACAFLVMQSGHEPLTVEELGEYLGTHGLAKYKFPERVEIRASLPLSNVGKVSRKTLREEIAQTIKSESL